MGESVRDLKAAVFAITNFQIEENSKNELAEQ